MCVVSLRGSGRQAALLAAIPKKHAALSAEDGEGVEVVTLSDVDAYASYANNLPEAEDDDDDEGPGGRGVQCAQS